jgi:hypothetical protein
VSGWKAQGLEVVSSKEGGACVRALTSASKRSKGRTSASKRPHAPTGFEVVSAARLCQAVRSRAHAPSSFMQNTTQSLRANWQGVLPDSLPSIDVAQVQTSTDHLIAFNSFCGFEREVVRKEEERKDGESKRRQDKPGA